jgi:hypothetical protein
MGVVVRRGAKARMTQPPHPALADPGLVLVRGPDHPDLQDEKGWIMSVKLTDVQLVMMSDATQRKDRCLSAPATIKGAALSKVSAKLMKLDLAREVDARHHHVQIVFVGGSPETIRQTRPGAILQIGANIGTGRLAVSARRRF